MLIFGLNAAFIRYPVAPFVCMMQVISEGRLPGGRCYTAGH